jgi:hypothetical protein
MNKELERCERKQACPSYSIFFNMTAETKENCETPQL